LPLSAREGATSRDWGLYVHIPFCAVRCGYCDFNTYTATELRGVTHASYPENAVAEMELASRVMDSLDIAPRPLSTMFFGGGTPTLLGPKPLLHMVERARELWGFATGAEITVEANPDSVDASELAQLAAGGVTRVSFGVQSLEPGVLATLDRTHNPDAVPAVIEAAKAAGLHVSVDLIFGSPGETLQQWRNTLTGALSWEPDHISAYALIVEPGTALARRIDRGELLPPDDDLHADMYELADQILGDAGFHWYEISNWARNPDMHSRHNRSYWSAEDWWGIGPGAHSHVGGVRWWNVKHPAAYAARMSQGLSPAHARELLTPEQQRVESILLGLRLREGIDTELVGQGKAALIAEFIARGYLDGTQALARRLVLTPAGRLLADYVIRELC
jgi:putative oxygen-independent coproporphyrinogen III oxidase